MNIMDSYFFALVVLALYLFFSKKKVDKKARNLEIEPKNCRRNGKKKIISDAKKHRFEREL